MKRSCVYNLFSIVYSFVGIKVADNSVQFSKSQAINFESSVRW